MSRQAKRWWQVPDVGTGLQVRWSSNSPLRHHILMLVMHMHCWQCHKFILSYSWVIKILISRFSWIIFSVSFFISENWKYWCMWYLVYQAFKYSLYRTISRQFLKNDMTWKVYTLNFCFIEGIIPILQIVNTEWINVVSLKLTIRQISINIPLYSVLL